MEFQHIENVLQHRERGITLGVHAYGYPTNAGGLNGAIIAKDDVDGGCKGGVMLEPVAMRAHVARGTGRWSQ